MSDKLDSIDEAPAASSNESAPSVKGVKKKKARTRKTSTTKAEVKKTTSRPRKNTQKSEVVVEDNHGNVKESERLPSDSKVNTDSLGALELKLSKSLHRKLIKQAYEEGVEVEEFVSELLSEGVVLRAWEIVERKNAMRGNQSGNSNQNRSKPQGGNSKGYKNKGHRMSHGRYQSIMDDSSNFIEYVRNQERGRR